MFEFVHSLLLESPLELYTAAIATLGVALWAIDRRSMKAVLKAATDSEVTSFRLERQKAEASVERSFAAFQIKCHATRDAWKNDNWKNGPRLGSTFTPSPEQREVQRIEQLGRSVFDRLNEVAPESETIEISALEAFSVAANRAALELERLASQLPQPLSRYH